MIFITVRTTGASDDALHARIDLAVGALGGRSRWRNSARASRSYGLLELPDGQRGATLAAAGGAIVFESPIIALAVFPAVAEALPTLLAALAGAGRPGGVVACEPIDGGIAIEWDPQRTSAGIVLGIVDVELARFHSGRTAELLTPLPPAWVAEIAADGLQAAGMSSDRVLEDLIERAGLHA